MNLFDPKNFDGSCDGQNVKCASDVHGWLHTGFKRKRGFRKGVQWIFKNILDHRWGRDRKISRNQLRNWKQQHNYDTNLAGKLSLSTVHTKLDTQGHGRIRIWQRLVYSKIARKLDIIEESTKPDKREVYYFKHKWMFKICLRKQTAIFVKNITNIYLFLQFEMES